jgi:hypothetical protein
LDERETEIYLALLGLKSAGATEIAAAARQSRSHAYLVLRALEAKGLVAETDQGGVLRFIAEPPERLLGYVRGKEDEYRGLRGLVEGALPLLSSLTKPYTGAPRVTTLKGIDGMKQVYRDILAQPFVGIYNPQASLDAFGENVVTMLFGADAPLRGRDLIVDGPGAKKYLNDVPTGPDYAVRVLPEGVAFDTDTVVYGEMVTLFAFDDERTIIRIQNAKIADAFRAWFEMLWGLSRKP